MNIVYVDSPKIDPVPTPSIFLAGPTPRAREDKSWRPAALQLLELMEFTGYVFVPECENWQTFTGGSDILPMPQWDHQVDWEWRHLHGASAILFWIPRKLPNFPAFTTNVEFGYYLAKRPEVCVYGRPDDAEKTGYLDWLWSKINKEPYADLSQTVKEAMRVSYGHKL